MKIYLAGPMSGIPDYNFPAFDKATELLRAQGFEVFSPAENDRQVWGSMEAIKANANYRDCLRFDLNWVIDYATHIALLPGWEKSKGVAVEVALADVLGLTKIILGKEYV